MLNTFYKRLISQFYKMIGCDIELSIILAEGIDDWPKRSPVQIHQGGFFLIDWLILNIRKIKSGRIWIFL